jgi:predicted RNA binding protein YcfA (HicA-like mRNA interferase family)
MKWSEFEELARMKGWYFYRNGKNHYIYRHANCPESLLIERHLGKEMRPKIYKRLLKLVKSYE